MKRQRTITVAMVFALVAMVATDAIGGTITTTTEDMTAQGDWEVTVATGDSNVVSVAQTGAGKIIKKGAGTLVLTQASTFTGGLTISAGKVMAEAEGCLGNGKVLFDTSSSRQLVFNAPNATFPNDIEQAVYYGVAWNVSHIQFAAATTLSGNITSPGGDLTLDLTTAGAHATFTGSIDMGNHALMLDQVANVYLSCPVHCSELRVSRNGWGRTGKVYFSSTANSIRRIWIRSGDTIPTVVDAFGGAELYHYWRWGEENRARFDLGGLSQTISAIDSYLPEDGGNSFGQNPNGGTIWSTSAATLTITGGVTYAGSQVAVSRFRINNAISLVLDAPGFTQAFMERANLTSGSITVSNGTFRATDSVNFKNVPTLTVAAGGALETAVTNGTVFSGCTTCTVDGKLTVATGSNRPFTQDAVAFAIGANAEVTLPSGMVIYAASLSIGGVAKGPGSYTADNTPQIKSGAIVISGGSATWTGGGGADTGFETPDNWGGTLPDVLFGSTAAQFASGGAEASIGKAYFLNSILLSATDGFTFRKTSDAGALKVTEGVTSEKATADEDDVRQYVFEPTVTIDTTVARTITVATNDTVSFAGGLISPSTTINLTKDGPGTLELGDGTTIGRGVYFNEGTVVLKGLIASPGHVDQGGAGDPRWGSSLYMDGGKKVSLVLDGATIEKPFAGYRDSPLLTTVSNTVNTFKGQVTVGTPATELRVRGTNGLLRFEGGIASTWSMTFAGGGKVEICDHSTRTNSWRSFSLGALTRVSIEGTRNKIQELHFPWNTGFLELKKDHATLEPIGLLYFGYQYGNAVYTNTLSLNMTTQRVVNIYCKGANAHPGVIIGEPGSQLEISGYGTNTVNWAGGVSLLKTGEGLLRMSKKAFSSSGNVAVDSGVLEFADGGSWTNGHSVSVSGTGTLIVSQPATFQKEIELSLDDEGIISIADDVSVKVEALYVGGNRMQPGRYTYANAPEPIKSHLDPLTGGAIVVKRGGSAFIIR